MRAIQVDQIQNNLDWVQVLVELFSFRRLVAEDHDLGASNHLLQIGGKQRADVGDDFLDVLTVGARETSKRDIPIPDSHLTSLSQKPLDELHLRTLQIGRASCR